MRTGTGTRAESHSIIPLVLNPRGSGRTNGETQPGFVTGTLQRGETTVVVKQVPAEVCENCGEYYLSDERSGQVLDKAEAAVRSGAEVEILRFAA